MAAIGLSVRPAVAGDICVLLAPSRPPSESAAAFIDRLKADLGGERVEPLHVTVDRVATDDPAALIKSVHDSVRRLRPTPVRVDRLYFLPSQSRGPEIVKLEVGPDEVLDEVIDELLAALRRCGLPSLYPTDRAKPTITTLQRVTRRDSVETNLAGLPLELFVADLVIVSRITGLARYEILDTASMPTSG
jgi:2'-5' RNA ligase superfamily protein